jgi:alpha-glucosidase
MTYPAGVIIRCVVLLPALLGLVFAQTAPSVASPNGNLQLTFSTMSNGQLSYQLSFKGKELIQTSALGLEFQGRAPLGAHMQVTGSESSSHDQTYTLLHGKASTVRDHYNALRIDATDEKSSRKLYIEARAYDDAVAFRYLVPENPRERTFRLTAEDTEFRIAKDPITYALLLPNYRSMYESEYVKLPASAFANQGGVASSALIGLPLLMDVTGVGWAAITEANLRGNSSLYLTNLNGGWSSHGFQAKLAPDDNEPGIVTFGILPHHSAWRVILVGDTPGALLESNVITSLNPASALTDTSWIKPGKASWDWWSGSINPDGEPSFSTETIKSYVDFAAANHFEYMQIDAGWAANGDITKMNGKVNVPEVVRYASSKGVKVWIWLLWADVDKQMDDAFPLYEKWGVAGLKIDFIEHDNQEGIDWYYRVAEKAAQHHLMLDFHGATKPTGIERTWPNIMGYEAVLGMEQSKGGARDNPENRLTLPFTRMLTGPMDYTPGGFDNVTRDQFVARSMRPMVMGTRAQQLAMYVVYESPYEMVSDYPKAYRDQPAFQFIKESPTTWDETRVLDGMPGQFISIARRHGDEWFVGSMTDWSPRELDLPLGFLSGGTYTAEIYADADDAGQNPKNVRITRENVTRTAHLRIRLATGGGCAIRFYRASSSSR